MDEKPPGQAKQLAFKVILNGLTSYLLYVAGQSLMSSRPIIMATI
uniref:Uncharacterized protein n=1 Tax=Arundo donax TaxID=35708 RepID=A0A0A8YWX8_ARUDO